MDCKVVEIAALEVGIVVLEHVFDLLASTCPRCDNREDSSLAQNLTMHQRVMLLLALWKSMVDAISAYPSSLAVPPR